MAFVAVGLLGYATGILPPIVIADSTVSLLLELTLALLLFTDATKVHVTSWETDMELPTRLLAIGMPLTIVVGAGIAYLMFPSDGVIGAAIVATILAPTDAALGRAVVLNPRVPIKVREALGIESGLNDGIALPILLFLITLARAEEGVSLWNFFAEGIGFGVIVGLAFGAAAAFSIRYALTNSWITPQWVRIAIVAVALGTFIVADHAGGSGFIAAYVAGNIFGRILDRADSPLIDFEDLADDLGTTLTMTSFLIFGAFLLGPNLGTFSWSMLLYAVLSLTVVRMIPVAISMVGTRLAAPTVVYLGWFGPRGLASIIFAGVLVDEAGIEHYRSIVGIVLVTVALSVLLHGLTAPWGSNAYATWWETHRAHEDPVTPR